MGKDVLKLGFAVMASACLVGCAFHRTPWPAYEGSHAQAETAVFASFDQQSAKYVDARITLVDTTKTPSWEVGHPYWVRVKPGAHAFRIAYKTDYRLAGPAINWREATIDVTVADMKPGHVYVARYRESWGGVAVQVEDLGERPDFGINLGLEGVNAKTYKVEF